MHGAVLRTFAIILSLGLAAPAAPAYAQSVTVTDGDRAGFKSWRAGFRQRALANGIRGDVFDRAFLGVGIDAEVLRLDRRQPEFSRPIWKYLDSAVSDTRIANGRQQLAAKQDVMPRIQSTYGVDAAIVLAIWGLESAYGYNYGNHSVIGALATLAYDGRRQDFAEEQLLSALRIQQAGDIDPGGMIGSWAGAMGHTQFIPTSFEAYAVDFTGDGRRDVWAADAVDALASTANYLSRFGWRANEPWGIEVSLPGGVDYSLLDDSNRRPVSFWRGLGVRTISGGDLPDHGEAAIILPGGSKGPAFMVFKNFRVIKRYNNATSYALAVGHLADRIRGAGSFQASWPRGDRTLSRTEKKEMQRRLSNLGFDTGGVDGIIGPNTRSAVRAFQRRNGLTPDGYSSGSLLDTLRRASGG